MDIVKFVILLIALARTTTTVLVGAQMTWTYDAHATFYGDMSGGETMRKF